MAYIISPASAAGDPYLRTVVSILNFLKGHHPQLFTCVLPLLDWSAFITFYIVLEPHKTIPGVEGFIIPDEILEGVDGWNNAMPPVDDYAQAYKDIINSISEQLDNSTSDQEGTFMIPLAFSEPETVQSGLAGVRTGILNPVGPPVTPDGRITDIENVYNNLILNNTIGGVFNVLPDSTGKALHNLSKKLWQDEFRFTIFNIHVESLTVDPQGRINPETIKKLTGSIREKWPGNNYTTERQITNRDTMAANVNKVALARALNKFVNSSDFLYVSASPGSMLPSGSMSLSDTIVYYNRNYAARMRLGASPIMGGRKSYYRAA